MTDTILRPFGKLRLIRGEGKSAEEIQAGLSDLVEEYGQRIIVRGSRLTWFRDDVHAFVVSNLQNARFDTLAEEMERYFASVVDAFRQVVGDESFEVRRLAAHAAIMTYVHFCTAGTVDGLILRTGGFDAALARACQAMSQSDSKTLGDIFYGVLAAKKVRRDRYRVSEQSI
jgi:hypothetical protein